MSWNRGTDGAAKPTPKKPSAMKGVVAGVAVVVAAVAVFFVLSGKDAKPKAKVEKNAGLIKEVKPAAAPVYKEEAPKEDPERAAKKARFAKFKDMTPEERINFLFEEAKKKPLDLTPSTNRTFKTGTEQVMGWIFTTRKGDTPPILPKISIRDEAHLAEILIANNPILETDSEKAKEAKMAVEAAKKELIKYIKEGGDVHEFLQYYRDQLVQANHEFIDAQRSVIDMYRSGEDPALCAEYLKKVNDRLAERGIEKKINLPQKFLEKFSK